MPRHEELANAVMAWRREVEAKLGAFGGKEPVRNLGQDAATVAERGIRAHRPAMVEVDKDPQTLFENVVRLAILHVGDKADAAGIMLLGRIVKGLGGRRQRVQSDTRLPRFGGLAERRLGCSVHLSAPRAVADFPRPSFQIFRAYLGQSRLRSAQLEGVTRRIFFDPSLSLDPTTPELRSSAGAEALASSHKKWSAQLSYCSTMTEMEPRHKRWAHIFLPLAKRGLRIARTQRLTQVPKSSPMGASMNFASDNGAGVGAGDFGRDRSLLARQCARLRRG